MPIIFNILYYFIIRLILSM